MGRDLEKWLRVGNKTDRIAGVQNSLPSYVYSRQAMSVSDITKPSSLLPDPDSPAQEIIANANNLSRANSWYFCHTRQRNRLVTTAIIFYINSFMGCRSQPIIPPVGHVTKAHPGKKYQFDRCDQMIAFLQKSSKKMECWKNFKAIQVTLGISDQFSIL